MKIKTQDLIGPVLDWAVAKCDLNPVARHGTGKVYLIDTPWADKSRFKWIAAYSPSEYWAQGGPIIEREEIYVRPTGDAAKWECYVWGKCHEDGIHQFIHQQNGPTPLIAAMRCFVSSLLGDEVDVPEDLL